MNNKKVQKALWQVAKNNRTSVAVMLQEMRLAIEDAQKNPDPDIQALWKNMPRKGEKSTPEEVIAHIAGIIDKK